MSGATSTPLATVTLDPCTLLRQADLAWFRLNTGASVREVVDENGERVSYSTSNRAGLLAFIMNLQTQCTTYQALALGGNYTRPMRFMF